MFSKLASAMHAEEATDVKSTHEIAPELKSTFGVTSTPSTTSFEISRTERDIAAEMKREASAR